MNKAAERYWPVAVLLLGALAVVVTLDTWLSAGRHRDILHAKDDARQKVAAYAGRWAREAAYRQDLDRQQAWQPVALPELASRWLGPHAAQITPRPATAAADDWQRREVAIQLDNVPFAEAAQFLAEAAASLPPWRLQELTLAPSAEAGHGHLTAVLVALEKKSP